MARSRIAGSPNAGGDILLYPRERPGTAGPLGLVGHPRPLVFFEGSFDFFEVDP